MYNSKNNYFYCNSSIIDKYVQKGFINEKGIPTRIHEGFHC